jgi:signal recognition particle subunit SEC65
MDASKAPPTYSKWQAIYPLYINKAVSVADGRRVPLPCAVDNPKAEEMALVSHLLSCPCWCHVGRVSGR